MIRNGILVIGVGDGAATCMCIFIFGNTGDRLRIPVFHVGLDTIPFCLIPFACVGTATAVHRIDSVLRDPIGIAKPLVDPGTAPFCPAQGHGSAVRITVIGVFDVGCDARRSARGGDVGSVCRCRLVDIVHPLLLNCVGSIRNKLLMIGVGDNKSLGLRVVIVIGERRFCIPIPKLAEDSVNCNILNISLVFLFVAVWCEG